MTRSVRRPSLLALLTLLLAPLVVWAGPAEDFEQGRNAYLYGDFKQVVDKLSPLVDPDIKLADPEDLARAYELLGLSYFYLDRKDDARRIFERLVRFRPDMRLNPVLVPPPAVAFHEEVRAALADDIARERAALRRRQQEEEERRRKANQVLVEIETRRNSRLVAVLPFGVGQFQNDEPVLGGLLLGSELVSIGLSVTFFLMVEDLRNASGPYVNRFPREDLDRAESLQTAQLVSGGVAVGLMVFGAAHALWRYRDRVEEGRTTRRPSTPDLGPSGLSPFSFTF